MTSPSSHDPAGNLVRHLLTSEEGRQAVESAVRTVLEDADVKQQLKTEVNAAFRARVERAAPWYYRGLAALAAAGIIGSGLLWWWGQELREQRKNVQRSIAVLALVPEVVLKVGTATADFRRQKSVL